MNRSEETLTWLRHLGTDADFHLNYQYLGVSLIEMDRDALLGVICVQARAIARRAEAAMRNRTQESPNELL